MQQNSKIVTPDTGQAFGKTQMRLHTASATKRRKLLLNVLKSAGIMLISWFFGLLCTFFGTYPAGIALLCAASVGVPFVFLGL